MEYPPHYRGVKVIKKEFLDKMYFRLYQRKNIRMSTEIDTVKETMKEAELAIEVSIKDYIDTHQCLITGDRK